MLTAIFPKTFHVPIDPVNMLTKFEVCSQKNLGWSLAMPTSMSPPQKKILYALVSSYRPCIHIILVSARVGPKF